MGTEGVSAPSARPAWYALEGGSWRDYVTLLHPPYTAWHLSFVVIGGCLAPAVAWGRLGAAVLAFALAVGVGAHALDELRGRPLRTGIPSSVLVGLAAVSIAGACAIGVVGAITFEPWLVALVPVGLFLVLAYNLELLEGRFHSDLWFGLAWGGFPVVVRLRRGRGRAPRRRTARRCLRRAPLAGAEGALESRPLRAPPRHDRRGTSRPSRRLGGRDRRRVAHRGGRDRPAAPRRGLGRARSRSRGTPDLSL